MSDLIYLYGHVPADAPPTDLEGVAERPVEVLACGDAGAVISRVPRADYSPDAIEARLEDMPWLGRNGVAHERVVSWYVDRGAIVPARLFTLFSSEHALREDCAERAGEITRQLDRLGGLREWDLKIACDFECFARESDALSPEIAELDREIADATPGRRYLLERRRGELTRDAARAAAAKQAASVLDDVRDVVAEARRLEAPAAAGRPGELPVVLHAALLVPRAAESEVRRRIADRTETLERVGLHITFSGPWAAYRFVGEQEAR